MSQKIVFFGSGDYSIPVVEMLTKHGLELVLTTEREGKLYTFLKTNNIPFISTHLKEPEIVQQIQKIKPTLGVLVSFGAIIPKKVIDIFPHGIWNIHPSLLPQYKGPSPIQSTILNGDKTTGVTIITLDDQVDHGPILTQQQVELQGNETLLHLKFQLFKLGGTMIEDLLVKLENGEIIHKIPQDHAQESFTEKITKGHGYIDIDNPPTAEILDRMIHAYYPWPGVWTKTLFFGKEKIVKLLPDEKIQVEGKNIMTYKEFVNGYQEQGETTLGLLGLLPSVSSEEV